MQNIRTSSCCGDGNEERRKSWRKHTVYNSYACHISYFSTLQIHTFPIAVSTSHHRQSLSSRCFWRLAKMYPKLPTSLLNMVTSICTPRRNFVKVWCSRLKDFKGMPVWRRRVCVCVCVCKEGVGSLPCDLGLTHTFKTITACSDTDYPLHWGTFHFLSRYKTAHWAVNNCTIKSLQLNSPREKT